MSPLPDYRKGAAARRASANRSRAERERRLELFIGLHTCLRCRHPQATDQLHTYRLTTPDGRTGTEGPPFFSLCERCLATNMVDADAITLVNRYVRAIGGVCSYQAV